jgi:uncharacterized protein (TIGR03083 family)
MGSAEQERAAMGKADLWPTIHAERKALAGDLRALGEQQWAARSLCSRWTVWDVVAHMTATAKITPPAFFAKMATSGFSLTRLQAKDIAVQRGASPADALARFEAVLGSRSHPPGPADTMLGETIAHAEDIRRPLGIRHDYPAGAVVQVADFYKNSNLILGTKRRIEGLALRATDADWAHGAGPTVSGPMIALLLAMTGRKAATGELSGDGVATLQARP